MKYLHLEGSWVREEGSEKCLELQDQEPFKNFAALIKKDGRGRRSGRPRNALIQEITEYLSKSSFEILWKKKKKRKKCTTLTPQANYLSQRGEEKNCNAICRSNSEPRGQ